MACRSIRDILHICAMENRSPLFYLMIHIFRGFFGNSIVSLRSFSLIGTFLLSILGIGPVRNIFGREAGFTFTALAFFIPAGLFLSGEAGMYTWAVFLTTGAAIFGFIALTEGKTQNYIYFVLFSISACFIHYSAFIGVIIINLSIIYYLMIRRNKRLRVFILCSGAVFLLYLPWAVSLPVQIRDLSADTPQNMPLSSVIDFILYPFRDKFRLSPSIKPWTALSDIPALIIAAGLIIIGLKKAFKSKRNDGRMAILAFLVFALTFFLITAFSEYFRPLPEANDMTPVMGLFLLVLAYGICGIRILSIRISCIMILALLFLPQHQFIRNNRFNGPMDRVSGYIIKYVRPGDVFLHTDEKTFGAFCYYLPTFKQYLYLSTLYKGSAPFRAFENKGEIFSNGIVNFMDNHRNFWLVTRPSAWQAFLADSWIASGKLKISGDVMRFSGRYSSMNINLFPVERTSKYASETRWGVPDITNTLDTHLYSGHSGTLNVALDGFPENTGKAVIILYEHGSIMPQNIYRYKSTVIAGRKVSVSFEDVPYGEYAIYAFHDRNTNERPDVIPGNFMEKEGISALNPEAESLLDFDEAGFILQTNETEVRVHMVYRPLGR